MAKKTESKRDTKKEWYQIEGKYQNEATTLLIDMKGNVYGYFGKNAFEAVGDGECYKTTFKRIN